MAYLRLFTKKTLINMTYIRLIYNLYKYQIMESTILQRIREIMNNEGLNVNSFSSKINVPRTTVKSMFEKNTNPSFEQLLKIIDAFTQYSTDWILSGKGDMLKKEQSASVNYHPGEKSINAIYHGDFTEPIHTEINSINNNGTLGDKNTLSPKKEKKNTDTGTDTNNYQFEKDYLIKRIESLEYQLEQAIADKERVMNLLDKLINK